MAEITAEEQNKVKRMKKIEVRLRDLWDHIKGTNIWITMVQEEEKKKGYEKNFEEILVEFFPSMEKEMVDQVQEEQRVPYRINQRGNMWVQFSSVSQSCPTLCDSMNCSTTGLPVHHQHSEFTQTHVLRVSDAIQPSHLPSSPSLPAHNPSQHQSLFQWVNTLHEVAKVLEFQL